MIYIYIKFILYMKTYACIYIHLIIELYREYYIIEYFAKVT